MSKQFSSSGCSHTQSSTSVHNMMDFCEIQCDIKTHWIIPTWGSEPRTQQHWWKSRTLTAVYTHTHTHTRVIWSACPAECSSIPEAAAARFVLSRPCCRLQTYKTHKICEHRFMHQLNWNYNHWFYFSLMQHNEFFHLRTSGYTNCMYQPPPPPLHPSPSPPPFLFA